MFGMSISVIGNVKINDLTNYNSMLMYLQGGIELWKNFLKGYY